MDRSSSGRLLSFVCVSWHTTVLLLTGDGVVVVFCLQVFHSPSQRCAPLAGRSSCSEQWGCGIFASLTLHFVSRASSPAKSSQWSTVKRSTSTLVSTCPELGLPSTLGTSTTPAFVFYIFQARTHITVHALRQQNAKIRPTSGLDCLCLDIPAYFY